MTHIRPHGPARSVYRALEMREAGASLAAAAAAAGVSKETVRQWERCGVARVRQAGAADAIYLAGARAGAEVWGGDE